MWHLDSRRVSPFQDVHGRHPASFIARSTIFKAMRQAAKHSRPDLLHAENGGAIDASCFIKRWPRQARAEPHALPFPPRAEAEPRRAIALAEIGRAPVLHRSSLLQ